MAVKRKTTHTLSDDATYTPPKAPRLSIRAHPNASASDNDATTDVNTAPKAPALSTTNEPAAPVIDHVASPKATQAPTTTKADYKNGQPGGFIKAPTARKQKMKWTAVKDNDLLIFGLGRDVTTKDFQKIADSFDEEPTAKSIMERLAKMRKAQKDLLTAIGIEWEPTVDKAKGKGKGKGKSKGAEMTASESEESEGDEVVEITKRAYGKRRALAIAKVFEQSEEQAVSDEDLAGNENDASKEKENADEVAATEPLTAAAGEDGLVVATAA
ncbi:hypothetical protein LTR53_017642 [Teratosphaeriaceae sp. CCFEE 6253]|nr:hypothetical protein LTR53_017642 [Teratosphaeriaceae sp. CCFEE 6253]